MIPTAYFQQKAIYRDPDPFVRVVSPEGRLVQSSEKVVAGYQLQQWWYSGIDSRYIGTIEKFELGDPKDPNVVGEWRDIERVA